MAVTMSSLIKSSLDKMNVASQRFGGLGTFFLGGAKLPAAGSISALAGIRYSISPALASTTAVHAAITCPTTGTTLVTTGITNPDVPRLLSVTGNQATVTGNVVIVGTDMNGASITDTIASSGTSTVAGAKAFATVTSITIPTRGAASDTIAIGSYATVGLPVILNQAGNVLAKTFDGSADAGTVTAGAAVSGNLYAAAGTFDGTKVLSLDILV